MTSTRTASNAILCRHGLQFRVDVDAALRRYRTFLNRDRRLAAIVWGPPPTVGFSRAVPVLLDELELPPPLGPTRHLRPGRRRHGGPTPRRRRLPGRGDGARSQPFQVIAVVDAHDPTMASQAVELAVTLH